MLVNNYVKNLDGIAKFPNKYSPEICIFSSCISMTRFQNLVLKLHTELATDTGLLKNDKFGSNFVLIKQNLPNSTILPPKNGRFKAWSHSVRKANWLQPIIGLISRVSLPGDLEFTGYNKSDLM